MDTVTQIEAQLIMRHYDGFTPRSGRIRGRRNWDTPLVLNREAIAKPVPRFGSLISFRTARLGLLHGAGLVEAPVKQGSGGFGQLDGAGNLA
jgi:hypothetical protein